MKIVATSCWHLGLMANGYDFFEDIQKMVARVIEETHRAQLFVHLGDVFHSAKPSPRDTAFAISAFDQVGCPTVVLTGNHDIAAGTKPSALEPLKVVNFSEEVRVIEYPTVIKVEDRDSGIAHSMAFVPYFTDQRANAVSNGEYLCAQDAVYDFFDHVIGVAGFESARVVFSHLDVEGADLGNGTYLCGGALQMPVVKAKRLPSLVVNGHIHKAQRMEPNIIMPGSIVPTSSTSYEKMEEVRQCYAVLDI